METAKEYGVHYVDLFVEPDEDVFVREPKKYTAFDGLHPTADGYAVWYTKLQVVLEKILIKG
jgi:lysophospholipase L1-like esterase